MNSNNNTYIFIYSVAMVVIVAAILSTAATLLKPRQIQNIKNEKMKSILASANIASTPENAETLYKKYVTKEIVINSKGEVINTFVPTKSGDDEGRAFKIDLKKEQFKQVRGEDFRSPLFILNDDGETYYIIPMLGKGLWGPVWGNMALKEDFSTIKGVVFDHKAETPGLGAEINTPIFEDQFLDKTIFDDNGDFVSITVQKGGVVSLPESRHKHAVDAISGGTITSVGVDDMMENCLKNYVPYIKNHK
jgi:Na+-transporting NADH:ubiquinone oxidoreductase subunit C